MLKLSPLVFLFLAFTAPMIANGQPIIKELPPEEKQLVKEASDMAMDGRQLAREDKYDDAIAKANSAILIIEKSGLPDNFYVWHGKVQIFIDLGTYYYAKGEYKLADEYLTRAKKAEDDAAAKGFSLSSDYLGPARFALIYQAMGDSDRALEYFTKSDEVSGQQLSAYLYLYSERVRIQHLLASWPASNWILSFGMLQEKKNPTAADLAFLSSSRRKNRIGTSMADLFQILRHSDFDKKEQTNILAMNQYFAANSALSEFYLKNELKTAQSSYSQAEAQYKKTSAKYDELFESKNTSALLDLKQERKPETLQRIRDALPANTALVDFVIYTPFDVTARENSKRWGETRYAAFVLQSGTIAAKDLGTTAEINESLVNFRAALSYPSGDVKELARALDAKLMEPLRESLGNTRTVFIAPDGQLNLVPFGALVDENDKYLIERYSFRYLTSARDLLLLAENPPRKTTEPRTLFEREEWEIPKRQGPVLIGDADFSNEANDSMRINNCAELLASVQSGEGQEAAATRPAERTSPDPQPASGTPTATAGSRPSRREQNVGQFNFNFERIPFTRTEASSICGYLPGVKLFIGQEATEENLKSVTGPKLLHIATHGYFIADAPPAEMWIDGVYHYRHKRNAWNDVRWDINPPEDPLLIEHPLLRSGLALTGANNLSSPGGQDGITTALEMMGLDLWGTKLVVLSACHTGMGDVQDGEGVFGLRRALLIAGAESQVISLWSVEDQGTSILMVDYYRRLSQQEGRSEALRNAQLSMLSGKDEERRHPYYWAGFIQSGAWTSIDLK